MQPKPKIQLPVGMRSRLEQFRQRVWIIKIIEGLMAGLFGLCLSYLVVFVIDRFVETPNALRLAILLAGTVGLAILFPLKLHRWVWNTRRLDQVARLLRHRFPRLSDQILGIVELAENAAEQQRSPRLVEAAMNQVDERVRGRDLTSAVPNPSHRRWLTLAIGVGGIAVALLLLLPGAGVSSLWRWLTPWGDTDRYTFAQFEPLPEQMIVPEAESFEIEVALRDKAVWRPDTATATLAGRRVLADKTDDRYQFSLRGQRDDGEFEVRVGDATDAIRVIPKRRPELTKLSAQVELPGYLQYSEPVAIDVRGGSLSVLAASRLTLTAETTRELAKAFAGEATGAIDGNQFTVPPLTIDDSAQVELAWVDQLGLPAKAPFRLQVNAVEDTPPQIDCTRLDRQKVLLSTDTLTFDVAVTDDYGVRRVGLEWKGVPDPLSNPNPQSGERLLAGGNPEETFVQANGTFSAEVEKLNPQTVQLRVFAEDYLPDRNRVYSPTYVVHIMSPDDHAVWMSEQMRRWFDSAESVYEEEQRLHEANRALRRMNPDELDQPAVRRQIEQQAAAERANASRLESATNAGRDLLEEALKNEQIRSDQLNSWAEMIQDLDRIAQDRMPNVSDMLDDAAVARAQAAAPSEAQPSETPDAGPSVGNDRSTPQPNDNEPGEEGEQESDDDSSPPSATDRESDLGGPKDPSESSDSQASEAGGRLSLPETQLGPAGDAQPSEEAPPQDVQDAVDRATEAQAELLEEFDQVRDKMQSVMNSMENSTFVKRLKAASRYQIEVAADLNKTLFQGFGRNEEEVDEKLVERRSKIGDRELTQSDNLRVLQAELEVYYNRRQDAVLRKVLDDMLATQSVARLAEMNELIGENGVGEAIAHAEYWADTLDRWAEELVPPVQQQQGQSQNGEDDSLPPSIVLEVMRIIDEEMDLREATRSLEQAKSVMEEVEYGERAMFQTITQLALQERTLDSISDIRALPSGSERFSEEIGKLTQAVEAMDEAQQILSTPNTGEEAIGAETAAIEALLQSRRAGGNGGGGGNSPGGGGNGQTDQPALDLVGPGSDPNARVQPRQVGDATGDAGRDLPEEFREGLDAFFNALSQP